MSIENNHIPPSPPSKSDNEAGPQEKLTPLKLQPQLSHHPHNHKQSHKPQSDQGSNA